MKQHVFSNRNALVIGMARSGFDAAFLLDAQGARIHVYDHKEVESIQGIEQLSTIAYNAYFGGNMPDLAQIDLVVVSPGVPLDIPLLREVIERDIELIGEVELAYRCAEGKFIGITGTNGKTTTTALLGEMFKAGNYKSFVVGNIGVPISRAVLEHDAFDVVYIAELSSYQLETVKSFSAVTGALLNITPDHLARHKTMDAYTCAKLNLFNNMRAENIVLNFDHDRTRALLTQYPHATVFSKYSESSLVGISTRFESKSIVVRTENAEVPILALSEIKLLGEHNIENALAAVTLAHIYGVDHGAIAHALHTFSGYPHRIEFVATIDGVSYYNDSKATNPEASIPAIRAMTAQTVLIAGGMDKGSDYREWIETFTTIKHVILFGETKHAIAQAMSQFSQVKYTIVNNLQEATTLAKELAHSGDFVLLSPACASWDMFESYEERGALFKHLVRL